MSGGPWRAETLGTVASLLVVIEAESRAEQDAYRRRRAAVDALRSLELADPGLIAAVGGDPGLVSLTAPLGVVRQKRDRAAPKGRSGSSTKAEKPSGLVSTRDAVLALCHASPEQWLEVNEIVDGITTAGWRPLGGGGPRAIREAVRTAMRRVVAEDAMHFQVDRSGFTHRFRYVENQWAVGGSGSVEQAAG